MGTSSTVKTNGVTAIPYTTGKSIFSGLFSNNTTESVWIDEADSTGRYPRTEKINFKADPLALAVEFRNSGLENWAIAEKLTRSTSWETAASKESVAQAEQIKRYYKNRFMLKALKTGTEHMSQYRRNLYDFVESDDPYAVYKNDIPMIVKLPDFYEEDCAMDDLSKQYRTAPEEYFKVGDILDSTFQLTPVVRIDRKTKNSKDQNYYFANDKRRVFKISLKQDNPLLHLFEREFSKESVTVRGNAMATTIRGVEFGCYNLTAWQLL